VAFGVDERFQREPQFRWKVVFSERSQQGHRGLVGVKLRDATGTALEVLLQLPLDRRRELMFEIIRQQADHVAALAGVLSHGVSNAELARPDGEAAHLQSAFSIRAFSIETR
jgi:hypothetical protein